ncbi:long fiber [simian adenovirus 2]|uniref:Fiber-3 n=1 Tax=simian adenovirus 2 TaxID=38418 RepID=A0A679A7G7_9ADEN|nr:long fiber [Simian adenovirus 2]
MKRARIEEDFNPVYPYDPPYAPIMPFITPPFTSSDGLQEKPFGILSLNYKDPITTQNGSLTLKLGNGLNINNQGELTSTAGAVQPPLTNADNKLTLAYSEPLTVQNKRLTLSHSAPLAVADNSLSLQVTDPIFINADNKLALQTDAPLNTTTGVLRLKSAAPLGLVEQTLNLLFAKPLYLQGDFLALAIERPLAVTADGLLALALDPPLKTSNTGLGLLTAAPLTVTNGNLNLNVKRPFVIQDNSLYMDFRAPLRLFNSEPQLGVNFTSPLTVRADALTLDTGNGLQVLFNKLTLNLGRDLEYDNGAIAVRLNPAAPLQYTNQLQLNLGAGLRLGVSKKLTVDVDENKGLTWNGNQLVASLGTGLAFDNYGRISVVSTAAGDDTLWTTADPSPNCTVYEQLDARLWLSLVKCGGMVQGSVALKAEKGRLLNPTASFISIVMYFDRYGVWRTDYPTIGDDQGIIANSATWGYRRGESADTNVTNALKFMPSSRRYPINQGNNIQNQMITYTCIQGDVSMPVPLKITFNHAFEGYSFKFTWRVVTNQRFDIPCCSFSYITEE